MKTDKRYNVHRKTFTFIKTSDLVPIRPKHSTQELFPSRPTAHRRGDLWFFMKVQLLASLWWPQLSLPPPLPVLIWRRNLLGKSFGKNTTGSALLERDEVELHHSHHTGPTNLRGELVWDGGDLALHVVVGRQLQDEPGKIGPLCIACEGLQQNLGKRGEACYRVSFFTGPVLKVLSMELVPPNKEKFL